MKRAKRIFQRADASVLLFALFLAAVFAVMTVGNFLTDKCADDYAYLFSFADGSRMESFSQILPSMKAHAQTMNGRLIAHTFVQIFEMLPKSVFNVVNAAMFAALLWVLIRLCVPKGERSNFFAVGVFATVWIFEPSFGQVNFWLDGSCNYLWMSVFTLLYILPFVRSFTGSASLFDRKACRVLFVLYGFFAGACLENMSGAVIFMACLFLILEKRVQKKNILPTKLLSVLSAMVGYACMVFAPAERQNKSSASDVLHLLYQFEKVMDRFHYCRVVIAAFVILLFASVCTKVDKTRLLLSGVFACGAFGAGMIFVLTRYYPGRCLAGFMLLLTVANGILAYSLLQGERFRPHVLCLLTLLALSLCYYCPHAVKDQYLMHQAVQQSNAELLQKKQAGETDITVPIPVPETPYCAFEGLVYLSEEDVNHLSNKYMAQYFGVHSVLGTTENESE